MRQVSLDASQQLVAEVDAGTRQVVIAPAGTGKTETVAALVEHLVDEEGVDASQEILVLSFSRAAVSALRRRFAAGDRALRGLNVRTLDALAARIIASAELDIEPGGSFDTRIEQATRLLRDGQVSDELEIVEHVVVDEVQDVVGVRALFVLEILKAVDAGFTVLGDPQQAIYDFQLRDDADVTSARFLAMLDQRFAPVRRALETNYRAVSDDARRFAQLGARLDGMTSTTRTSTVRDELASVPAMGAIEDLVPFLGRWEGQTTAFLCDTNGVAMTVRDRLRELGVQAALQSSADQRGVTRWVADTLDRERGRTRRSDFFDRWEEEGDARLSAAEAWRLVKRMERGFTSPDVVETTRVAAAVARRDVPAELLEPPVAEVIVSTIHRSKGLEFDNVVLVDSRAWLPGDAGDDKTSAAYVALTRARDRIFAADAEVPKGLRKDEKSGRWVVKGFKHFQTHGFELRPADTRSMTDPARIEATADYIRERIAVGDELTLSLNRALSDLIRPVYDVFHDGWRIGVTTEDFGFDLKARLGYKTRRWPILEDLRIDGFETRGCGPEYSAPGVASLWRGVVVTGMARLNWNVEDE
ncbi:UvrD-helicase domain-containing protein [Aeromicrobium senzhongii]|nr:UvrD-helicase domain-containing protein [Aeromicrobium senzhongii]